MKTAPYARIVTGPDPADSGLTLEVTKDLGAAFSAPPFTALIWPIQMLPTSTNSDRVTVTTIVADAFEFTRADGDTFSIVPGLQIAELLADPVYQLASSVTLTGDEPGTIHLQDPGGALEALALDDGGSISFPVDQGGVWAYYFDGPDGFTSQEAFFVTFEP